MCLEHSCTQSLCSHSVISRHKQCHSVSFPTTLSVSLSLCLCVQTLSSLSVCSNSVDTRSVHSNSDTQSVCRNPSSSTIFEREGNKKHPSRPHFEREGEKKRKHSTKIRKFQRVEKSNRYFSKLNEKTRFLRVFATNVEDPIQSAEVPHFPSVEDLLYCTCRLRSPTHKF